MSETMKSAAAAYARDPQRPGLVERLLKPWNASAGSGPAMMLPEESFMNQHVNRRAVMAGSAGVAGIAFALGSSVSQAEPAGKNSVAAGRHVVDPKLRKLEAAFKAQWKKYKAALPAHSAAQRGCVAAKPPRPEEIKTPGELFVPFRTLRLDQMNRDNPHFAAICEYQDMNKARLDRWRAECEAIERRPEFTKPTQSFRRQLALCDLAAERVFRFPARSLADIQVKIQVHRKWSVDDEEALLRFIIADIARVAKCQRQTRGDVSRATGGVTT
ncbi:hypothetical protein [Mesorhizobium sp. M0678]|uniref:hypothetical protein n=1 Tax=Mesorhizobium sp. M0678 TaxID=2956985 RepID=UPI00333B897F